MQQYTNNQQSSLTYEQLMKSGFVKHPKYNATLYALFNPFVVAALILVIVTTYVTVLDGDWTFGLMVGIVCSLFLSLKIALIGMMMSGHGVGLIKKGKVSLLGLPTTATIFFIVIFVLINGVER